jgi:formate hydrogenlyase transcriptional activator
VKLLRVLQERTIERIGAHDPIPVDVRIIAATHRDLAALVASGRFRLDLYHRLAVVPLVVPPLRDRPEDLDVLVPYLLERIARRHGVAAPSPSTRHLRLLRAHAWPGNVRELENVLERALLFDGGKLAIEAALAPTSPASPVPHTFADASRAHIEAALRASGGKIHGADGAAKRLALKPTTLQSKMRKLGIARAGSGPR